MNRPIFRVDCCICGARPGETLDELVKLTRSGVIGKLKMRATAILGESGLDFKLSDIR
jgi:hypothetical protein